jgi:mRNA-degrading endonuclease toxin of MazEF toxin-antitoxin module
MTPGDIALIWFPFSVTEAEPYKKRPVLVLGATGRVGAADEAVLVAMITSSAGRVAKPGPFDVAITDWEKHGLIGPSVCRANRLWTAQERDFVRVLASVDPADLDRVKTIIRSTFSI